MGFRWTGRVAATSALLLTGVMLLPTGSAAQPPNAHIPVAAAAVAYDKNQVRNGGFERPEVDEPWVAFFPTGPKIPGWTVEQGSVDVVSTDWPAGRGKQSLGLNGYEAGKIWQRLRTVPGATYRISFLLWGDPNGPPSRSKLAVAWGGHRVRTLTVDVSEQPDWRRVSFLVRAERKHTRLTFRGLTKTNAGPALDAIRVQRVSCD